MKEEDFSEWYSNIIKEAEIVDIRYPVKGMPVYYPYGYMIFREIMRNLELLLEEHGYLPAWFPIFIPKEIFSKEEKHILGFEQESFKLTEGGNVYIVRPTSETEMYHMYSLWISSYRDLPLKLYMTNTVYRNETKATKPLIRGAEILWNEAHSAHKDLDDAMRHIYLSIEIYSEIYRMLHLPHLWLRRPEWDKFAGADITFAADTITPDGRFLQIGTTHLLGRNFSKVFDIIFEDKHPYAKIDESTFEAYSKDRRERLLIKIDKDNIEIEYFQDGEKRKIVKEKLSKIYELSEDNQDLINEIDNIVKKYFEKLELDNRKYVWQISFGISMRVLGATIMLLGDDKGLLLPFKVAPIQIVIIPIYYSDQEKNEIIKYCKEIYNIISPIYRVKLDLDEEKTPGWKFNYYEMKGVPIRIEIGKKEVEEKHVTISVRVHNDRSKKYYVSIYDLNNSLEKIVNEYEKMLDDVANREFNERIVEVNSIEEFEDAILNKKVVKANFCMREECAKNIKEKYGVDVRGTKIDPELADGNCIFCGEKGVYKVYIGKSY